MKAYKVFDSDWKCRGYQYEVGKEYRLDGSLMVCRNGFHFCERLADCFNYYGFDPSNKVAEVEVLGEIDVHGDKGATDHIKIVREMTWNEVLNTVNTGVGNSGYDNSGNNNSGYRNSGNLNTGNLNSGNGNSGDYNSGNKNSGNRNSGDNNSGNRNIGNFNSGHVNAGHYNSGDFNSGDFNSGDFNSGYFNSGDGNSGYFNTNAPTVRMFNKDTGLHRYELARKASFLALGEFTRRVYSSKGKEDSYQNDYKKAWKSLSWTKKRLIKELPNFDKDIFFEITGIKVR